MRGRDIVPLSQTLQHRPDVAQQRTRQRRDIDPLTIEVDLLALRLS